eukprot:scaffold3091_cov103-Skeletonema_marinoi.AAC.1
MLMRLSLPSDSPSSHPTASNADPTKYRDPVTNISTLVTESQNVSRVDTQDLDAAEIVRIVNEIDDPADAARTLVKSSAALWAEKNDYCDDITAIVIFIKHDNVGSLGIVERPIEINHEAKQVSSKASLFRRFLQRKKKKKAEKKN